MDAIKVLNTLAYDATLCTGCGMCSLVCPHEVFALPRDTPQGRVAELVRPDDCMECGACQLNCPTGAITVDSGTGCAIALMRAAISRRRGSDCKVVSDRGHEGEC
jgi:NAD-dependent dihydropyrimidine dehydrogenase PreA subunit